MHARWTKVKLLLFSGFARLLTAQRMPAAQKDQMTPQKRKPIEAKVL